MPRVGKKKLVVSKEELARRRPVVLQGSGALVADRSVTEGGASGAMSLADALQDLNAQGGRNVASDRFYEENPLVWVREKHPYIESKTRGLASSADLFFKVRGWRLRADAFCRHVGALLELTREWAHTSRQKASRSR